MAGSFAKNIVLAFYSSSDGDWKDENENENECGNSSSSSWLDLIHDDENRI